MAQPVESTFFRLLVNFTDNEPKNKMKLQELGFSRAEIEKKIVDTCVDEVLGNVDSYDEDGRSCKIAPQLREEFNKRIKETVNARIAEVFEKECKSNIIKFMEEFSLQQTNSWGEKTGKKLTLTEYFIERIEAFIKEEVNHHGKSKSEDSYSWSKHSTRIVFMMHEYFQYHIKQAMEETVKNANSTIAQGIQKAVEISLQDILKGLKVNIK